MTIRCSCKTGTGNHASWCDIERHRASTLQEEGVRRFSERGDVLEGMETARIMLPLHGMMEELMKASAAYLEFMAAAFLKETGLPASEVELVAFVKPNMDLMGHTEVCWRFRRRENA